MQPNYEFIPEVVIPRVLGTLMLLALALCMALLGCQKRETILDVDAPGVDIKVEKTTDLDGTKSIEVKKDSTP